MNEVTGDMVHCPLSFLLFFFAPGKCMHFVWYEQLNKMFFNDIRKMFFELNNVLWSQQIFRAKCSLNKCCIINVPLNNVSWKKSFINNVTLKIYHLFKLAAKMFPS